MIKTYKGIDYIVHFRETDGIMSFYTAYIRLPENHTWIIFLKKRRWFRLFGKGPRRYLRNYDGVPAEVHGGLTFGDYINKKKGKDSLVGFTPGWWIGWDYAHVGDAVYPRGDEPVSPTLSKLRKENLSLRLFQNFPGDHRWKESEVEEEVKEAIEQLLKAGGE